ncbi:MAG: tetratricopeptide repeat protein [Candidatus Eisenbacteria bacterium]|uniref:Tetratricopeptide repeat protein n=1 Tax=Eiseniibacteriota bacterium TaxID=2212470 RepID=A0A956LYK5_UNCEI|nr:tetratricopeptide repeat protein [Candidatus Eisenbacteria bacterium]
MSPGKRKSRPKAERRLAALGDALSARERVDWDDEAAKSPALHRTLQRLRQLESLRDAHRRIADSFPDVGPAGLFDWGPLRVLERIGEGGFGEVFRALDIRLQREVALKLRRAGTELSGVGSQRFLDEARSLARVRHSNVLVVHGADIHDGRAGFWTDFIEGRTLAAHLQEDGPMDAEATARIGVALCRALTAVHTAGLIHGDVKPANVMCEASGRILLMDFGAVTRRPRSDEEVRTGRAGEVLFGTPLFLAPELLVGGAPTPESDLYSLGVVLYQQLSGELPVRADEWAELLERHRTGDVVPLSVRRPNAPRALVDVIERALSAESKRYASAAEMERALLAAVPAARSSEEESQSLRALVAEIGRVPEEMGRQIARETAKALTRVHSGGGTSLPLSLESVRIGTDGHVEITRSVGPSTTARTGAAQTAEVRAGEVRAGEARTGEPSERSSRAEMQELGGLLSDLMAGSAARDESDALPSNLSPFFRQIVDRLLGRGADPAIESAAELLSLLTEGEEAGWWRARVRAEQRKASSSIRRISIPRDTPLQGRDRETGALRDAYEQAKAGAGRVVLILGEAGIGKTRLVADFVDRLWEDGERPHFLFGSYPPGGGAGAAGALLDAYRDHVGDADPEEALRQHLRAAPLLIPAFAALLRGGGVDPNLDPLTKESLHTGFVHILRSLAAERPTILLVDDLHFGPTEGLGVFSSLALAVPGQQILLIGGARLALSERWEAEILRLPHARSIALDRLPQPDVKRILADVIGSAPLAEELAPRLTERSDGNPLFLFEHLRALEDAGVVQRGPDGRWSMTGAAPRYPTPSRIQHLIRSRFAALAEEDKELLDLACCCGFEFDPLLVGLAAGLEALPTLRRFALIEAHHGLVRSSGRRYSFDHHQVQESLYEGLFPPLREQYHAMLGQVLEQREVPGRAQRDPGEAVELDAGAVAGATAVTLCEHFFRGARPGDGIRYLKRSLDHLGTLRLAASLDLMEHALGSAGLVSGPARIDLLAKKATFAVMAGKPEAENAALEEMMRLADEQSVPLEQARARRMLGFHCDRTGQIAQAERYLEEAERYARTSGDVMEESRVAATRGQHAWMTSRYDEALPFYQRCIELARSGGDRWTEARAIGALGIAYQGLRRFEEAQRYVEEHLGVCRELGSAPGVALATGNLGAVLLASERYAEAVPVVESHLRLARESGYRMGEATALGNSGFLYVALGRGPEALALLERSLEVAREVAFRFHEAEVLAHLAAAHQMLGHAPEAHRHYDRSLTLWRELKHPSMQGGTLLGLGLVAEDSGDPEVAASYYEEAERVWTGAGLTVELAEWLLWSGRLDRKSGRIPEARDKLARAVEGAREHRHIRVEVLALAHSALLPGGDADEALERYHAHRGRLPVSAELEACHCLWKATGDRAHLSKAAADLAALREHAPPADRAGLYSRVPLYREIDSDWRNFSGT